MSHSTEHLRRLASCIGILTRMPRRHVATGIRVCGLLAIGLAYSSLVLRAQSLPANLTITSATPAPYQANVAITTSGPVTVNGSTTVRYVAGSQINLEPGFHAIAGTASPSFDASILPPRVTPSSGSGVSQTFTFSASEYTGYQNITHVQMIVNWGPTGVDGCLLDYDAANDALHIGDRSGSLTTLGSMPLASSPSGVLGDLINTNCQVVGSGSSLQKTGINLVLTLKINFAQSFIGPQNIYTQVSDQNGAGPYQFGGTWTAVAAPSAAPPTGVAPSAYDSTTNSLTVAITDVNGFNYMPEAYLEFGVSQSDPNNTCRILFQRGTGAANDTLTLYGGTFDSTGRIAGAPVGTAGAMAQSNACLVDIGRSHIAAESGNTSQLVLAVTFKNGTAGTVNAYVGPVDRAGAGATVPVNGVGAYSGFATSSFYVLANDFTLQAPDVSMQAGNMQGIPITITPSGSFSSAISLSCSPPSGMTCSVASSAGTYTGSVTASATAVSGNLTITATGGGITHATTIKISVTPAPVPTFSVNWPTTTISTLAGQPVSYPISVTGFNGWSAPVVFSMPSMGISQGLSACITNGGGCLQSYAVYAGGTVIVQLKTSNPTGGCAMVYATGNATQFGSPVCVSVQANVTSTFQISTVSSVTVPAGGSVPVQLNTIGQAYSGSVTLTSSNTQGNVLFGNSTSATLASTPGTATINFIAGSRPPNVYSELITATSATGVVQSQSVLVTVAGPSSGSAGFQVSAARTAGSGNSSALQFTVYNDGNALRWYTSGAGDPTSIQSCTVSIAGVLIQKAGSSYDASTNFGTFDVDITAAPTTPSGSSGKITCGSSLTLGTLTILESVPVIQSVQLNQPLYAGGQAYATIYGLHFGSSGSVGVCQSTTSQCNGTPDIASQVTFWGCSSETACQINVQLTASQTASGSYDLQVNSTGLNGTGFLQAPVGPQIPAQSNRKPIQTSAPVSSILDQNAGNRDITNATANIWVGTQVKLQATVAPSSPAVVSSQWTIGGCSPVGGYAADSQTGSVQPLNQTMQTLTFYCSVPISTMSVRYTASLAGGQTVSAVTSYSVAAPDVIATPTQQGPDAVVYNPLLINGAQTPIMQYGVYVKGMSATYGLRPGSTNTIPAGAFQWVQIVKSSVTAETDDPTVPDPNPSTVSGLDTKYPATTASTFNDSPVAEISTLFFQTTRNDSFTLYLMFQPAALASPNPNIYVPVRSVDWTWGGTGTHNADGTFTVSGNPFTPVTNDASALGSFPQWTTTVGAQ